MPPWGVKRWSTSSVSWLALLLGSIAATLAAFAWPQNSNNQQRNVFESSQPKFSDNGQSIPCTKIAAVLAGNVYSSQHPAFNASINEAFAVQAREEVPSCIVKPVNADQVSTVINVLKTEYDAGADARFAVRSGGHRPGGGHSSIRNGVLVDLRSLNDIIVSQDRTEVTLGVGSRWGEVYSNLEEMELMVAGGRDSSVGVGGFSLGGGISYYSSKVGMACDNIIAYKIVLANGSVATVSETRNHDLWRTLKGGSSNFGIVTHVTFKSFPSTKIWGGYALWTTWQASKIWETLYDFMKHNRSDTSAAAPIICIGYQQKINTAIMAGIFAHTKPFVEGMWPSAFRGFSKLWALWTTFKIRKISDLAKEVQDLGRPSQSRRQVYGSITIKSDLDTLRNFTSVFNEHRPEMKKIDNVIFSLIVQPLPIDLTSKKSPNILGLDARDFSKSAPVLILITAVYGRAEDDQRALQTVQSLLADIKANSVMQDAADPFIYLNYAGDWQEPMLSYGSANMRFLRAVSQKYDKNGFFQKALEGGFKLGFD